MLDFARNKLVSVAFDPPDRLKIHGVLDDTIYGLELDVIIDLRRLAIETITGHWNRHTTPDCPRALTALQKVKGFEIWSEDFTASIHKIVGRQGCRHFANLLLECCDSAREAARLIGCDPAAPKERSAMANAASARSDPDSSGKNAEPAGVGPKMNASESVNGSFRLEMHLHSFPASACSTASIESLIAEAKRIGLNGVCITDHNHVWRSEDVEKLKAQHDFIVLRGNEITTDQGDVLVFGLEKDIQGIVSCSDLRKEVESVGGYMIAAHPFRGFLTFNVQQIGLTPEKAAQRRLFQCVDAIEVLNSKVSPDESAFARQVAKILGLPMIGGSDAHAVDEVGIYATCFEVPIQTEIELVEALKSGRFSSVAYRKELSR